jgi:hypothetical protein
MRLANLLMMSLVAAAVAPGATIVFTDRTAWAAAVGSFASDDFSTATPGGPFPQYVSTTGMTLRRAESTENNGNVRTTSTDYNGDVRVDGQPYSSTSSTNRIIVSGGGGSFGPPFPHYLLGPSNHYASTSGQNTQTFTRLSDGATRTTETVYSDQISRQSSAVAGTSAIPINAVGFSLLGFAGPFPATLTLSVNGQSSAAPFFASGMSFFGIVSTDPFTHFLLGIQAGRRVTGTESYTNRQCGFGGMEVCLADGNMQTTFTNADVSISELVVAPSAGLDSVVTSAVPEPGSGLLLIAGFAAIAAARQRNRRK